MTQVKMCPSAPWDSPDAHIFGVVAGEAKRPAVLYLKQSVWPSAELKATLNGVAPEEVFRIAAPCAGTGCGHHDRTRNACSLIEKIVDGVQPVVDAINVCTIRPSCVWWAQEGSKACLRCPQISTMNRMPSPEVASASALSASAPSVPSHERSVQAVGQI